MVAFDDIPGLMTTLRITGASVAVVGSGGPAVLRSYGTADAETAKPVTEDTVFEVASLSKPLFAFAVLKLVDAGLLSLDEPLHSFAPNFVPTDTLARTITARHVLSHTTGFPNWRSDARPLQCYFPPGSRFSYSGEGYCFLQTGLEHVTGEPLEALARRLVFEPLGMRHSAFDARVLQHADLAKPHDGSGRVLPKQVLSPSAAGSLHTTARDYGRFLCAVLKGEGLSPDLAELFTRPVKPLPKSFFAALDPVGAPETHRQVAWDWDGASNGLIGCSSTGGRILVSNRSPSARSAIRLRSLSSPVAPRSWLLDPNSCLRCCRGLVPHSTGLRALDAHCARPDPGNHEANPVNPA